MNFDPTMEPECVACDHGLHLCRFCGDELRHDGNTLNGDAHNDCDNRDNCCFDEEEFTFEQEDDAR